MRAMPGMHVEAMAVEAASEVDTAEPIAVVAVVAAAEVVVGAVAAVVSV